VKPINKRLAAAGAALLDAAADDEDAGADEEAGADEAELLGAADELDGATEEATELLDDVLGAAVGGAAVGAGVGAGAHAARTSNKIKPIHITRNIFDILFFSFSFVFRVLRTFTR
jgi:hypothetical protein